MNRFTYLALFIFALALVASCGKKPAIKTDDCVMTSDFMQCVSYKGHAYTVPYPETFGFKCLKLEDSERVITRCVAGQRTKDTFSCEIEQGEFSQILKCKTGDVWPVPSKDFICTNPRHWARLVEMCGEK